MATQRLGRLLIKAGLITEEQLNQALAAQKKEGSRLGSVLMRLGFLEEGVLLKFLSQQYNIPFIDLKQEEIEPGVIQVISSDVAQKYQVVPVRKAGGTLSLAMVDPTDVVAMDDIKFMTGYEIIPMIASEAAIVEAIRKYYDSGPQFKLEDLGVERDEEEVGIVQDSEESVSLVQLKEAVEEAPVVKLANAILAEAIKAGASDIHIEAYEKSFRVRYRLDGSLYEVMSPPMKLKAALTSRIKIMADLDIAERRLPQDGRIKLKMKEKEVDLRVSTLPCLFGEKIVMRVLDKSSLTLDLTRLGFDPKALEEFKDAIQSPYGMVLVTGPTGSGKTTTLYSALNYINTDDINIMTAEDPVEYNLLGINQVQIKEEIGLTFASALRSFLRQDPDVILVGEIRDYETAEIGVKAALTGHLVLSTLHTNDAPSTIIRLVNMGVEPFLVAASVILILAQRLIRKICKECKIVHPLPPQVLQEAGFSPEEAEKIVCYKGKGCQNCKGSGYKGRVALYEVMSIGEEIRDLVLQGASADEIRKKAISLGMKTLRASGLQKVKDGVTTLEEVLYTTFGG